MRLDFLTQCKYRATGLTVACIMNKYWSSILALHSCEKSPGWTDCIWLLPKGWVSDIEVTRGNRMETEPPTKYIHAENNTVEQHVGPPWIQPQNSQLRNAASKWVIARHTYSILQYMFDFVLSRKGYRVMHLQNDASSEMLVKKPWCRHGAHHIGSGSRCPRIRRLLTKQCL